jgi:hypothetical protein
MKPQRTHCGTQRFFALSCLLYPIAAVVSRLLCAEKRGNKKKTKTKTFAGKSEQRFLWLPNLDSNQG